MTTSQHKTSESGQVLILMVLALMGMFAFVSLALDGGMLYSDRRLAQNAADAAALAGAGKAALELKDMTSGDWSCSEEKIKKAQASAKNAAQARAASNDFLIDLDISNLNGVTTLCKDGSKYAKYIDVHVMITFQTETALVHLVYKGPLKNTVEAVARVYPRFVFGEGNTIISLTDKCSGKDKDRGTFINGDMNIKIKNGGMLSNSCLFVKGNKGEVVVEDGAINYLADYTNNGGKTVKPNPVKIDYFEIKEIPQPDCGIYSSTSSIPAGKDIKINPGKYQEIKISDSKAVLTMNPGLYCIEGTFNVEGNFYGTDITIVMTSKDKSFKTSGSAEVQISAPPGDCDDGDNGGCKEHAVGGLLLYMNPDNDKEVVLVGNSNSSFSGSVYSPKAGIKIGGTADMGSGPMQYITQLIGYTVEVGGNPNITITYDDEAFYHFPTNLEVAR